MILFRTSDERSSHRDGVFLVKHQIVLLCRHTIVPERVLIWTGRTIATTLDFRNSRWFWGAVDLVKGSMPAVRIAVSFRNFSQIFACRSRIDFFRHLRWRNGITASRTLSRRTFLGNFCSAGWRQRKGNVCDACWRFEWTIALPFVV